ncbi:ATP-binding protein [Rubeoparvulum massiliense]|uniref:ATP-binding protein n=1 Tax=Rubeoparvulum massiliense TaxID=1631346 RepID=UPI00065E8444|nr:ATP-binding protein [Rubeoparvulum massiliense]
MKLWRSVVGKLWATIIGLVAIVLLILSLLLVQFFDSYFTEKQSNDLSRMAQRITALLEMNDHEEVTYQVAMDIVQAFDMSLLVISPDGEVEFESHPLNLEHGINSKQILQHPQLHSVFAGKTFVSREPFLRQGAIKETDGTYNSKDFIDMLVVGYPYYSHDGVKALFMMQSLTELQETERNTTRLIIYAATFGIIMTTIFALYLSSRVTKPLIQMGNAANQLAEGKWPQKEIPILTTDEIGRLAKAFNRMSRQLDDSIQALQHEKEQVYSIIDSMVDGVVTINRHGEVVLINKPAMRELELWSLQKNGTTHLEQITYLDLPEPLQDLFNEVLQKEEQLTSDIQLRGRDWSIVFSPLYDQSQVRGVVAVMRDLTEERKLDKLRNDFVANVSHELRTPISMLQGYSEAILDHVASSPEEQREIMQIIYDESLRMGRLVNELLDLARMQSGHLQLHQEMVRLDLLSQRALKKFTGMAKSKEIQLEEDIDPNVHDQEYKLDPDRMEQVLTNLIDNALRHTNPGGTVTLTVKEVDEELLLIVKDTGQGIPLEDLPFVFERFYKADKARTRGKKGGTGLGLAIVKHIVEGHRGQITVYSQENEGTSFIIRLPIAKEDKVDKEA